jgi:LPXTG-site transpeptidase (sortase) family protein
MQKFKNFISKNKKKLNIFANVLIFTGIFIVFLTYSQVIFSEIKFNWDKFRGVEYTLDSEVQTEKITQEIKRNTTTKTYEKLTPVSENFGIVIESLNVNAPIVKDVSIINETAYINALRLGVAHASFSDYPSEENARVYLFAHSAVNFWQLGQYSGVFNQLEKIRIGEKINIFYEGKRYVYSVENKVFKDNFYLDETVYDSIGPVLTIQTCYPAGTTKYRLIVTASLESIIEE